ncbi:hypothetical protein HOO54_03620 [Bacillus sp. WMMC1349]|uniref:hypothetical protein n=1 Tax=Bacillus sp. WMMC1349 TaxID=2736254 RepID=UPI001551C25B|nr:hypothetical protein [Bacillus sp. WMMC1349]NPC91356.1 hypothetical protein [Bacillus sp. WMMC1349]
MNYLHGFLLRLAVSLLFMIFSFSAWKSSDAYLANFIFPFLFIILITMLIIDFINLKKRNLKVVDENKEIDERSLRNHYKSGYYAFWMNLIFLGVIFYFFNGYSIFLSEVDFFAILGLVNFLLYYILIIYFKFFK